VVETEDEPEATTLDTVTAASALADQHGARLDLLACITPPPDLKAIAHATGRTESACLDALSRKRERGLTDIVSQLFPGASAPTTRVVFGSPFLKTIGHVLRHDIDLVVKAARPLSGLHGVFFASTDQHLLRKCPVPVWLRASGAASRPRTVIAAVDVDVWDAREPETLTALNRKVIDVALQVAGADAGVVHVLHAWDAVGEGLVWTFTDDRDARAAAARYVGEVERERKAALTQLLGPFQSAGTKAPHIVGHLRRGPARRVIPEEARRLPADLIVMGTVARTGLGGVIIGNTAEDILNATDCSVVAVKPDGFVSPVAAAALSD
jgi:nucleotide-binding universal stress UspA family protein